jgi:hypothetical protein
LGGQLLALLHSLLGLRILRIQSGVKSAPRPVASARTMKVHFFPMIQWMPRGPSSYTFCLARSFRGCTKR